MEIVLVIIIVALLQVAQYKYSQYLYKRTFKHVCKALSEAANARHLAIDMELIKTKVATLNSDVSSVKLTNSMRK